MTSEIDIVMEIYYKYTNTDAMLHSYADGKFQPNTVCYSHTGGNWFKVVSFDKYKYRVA